MIAELPRPEGPLGTEPIGIMGNQRKSWIDFFCGIARGRVRTTTTTTESRNMTVITETRLNLFSWFFCGLAPSIADTHSGVDELFQKTNLKEKSREQELTGRELTKEDCEREWARLKERRRKWYWTMPWSRASPEGNQMKQYRTMREPERARTQERKRNTQKIDSEG